MTEIIINYPSKPVLVQLATVLGYYDPIGKAITAQGAIATGGSYFFNNVGVVQVPTGKMTVDRMGNPTPEMAPDPNLWGRLRVNGEVETLPDILAACRAANIKVYELVKPEGKEAYWSSDGGTTPAPDWVQYVAVIA